MIHIKIENLTNDKELEAQFWSQTLSDTQACGVKGGEQTQTVTGGGCYCAWMCGKLMACW